MPLQFISLKKIPNYIALSTDIVDNKIEGAILIGKTIYITDIPFWYVINSDLTLSPYRLPPLPTAPAAAGWWLSGGISPANCVAAYQPKGASSLESSYLNIAHSGVFDCTVGKAPTFDTTTGWSFTKTSSQYLKTGIIPQTNYSVAIKCTPAAGLSQHIMSETDFIITTIFNATIMLKWGTSDGTTLPTTPVTLTNNIYIATNYNIYIDNNLKGGVTPSTYTDNTHDFYIGAGNFGGNPTGYATTKVEAVAVYNIPLTETQITALTVAMQAL